MVIMTTLRRCAMFLATAGAAHTQDLSIPNFHVVSPGIFRGGRPRAGDLEILARQGIKTVINLQGRDFRPSLGRSIRVYQPGERRRALAAEKALSESLGLAYYNLPFNSLLPVNDDDAGNIMRAVAVLADPKNHPVFIHCEHGRDRTGLIVAIYRVLHMGWSAEKAVAEWEKYGHAGWLTLKFTGNLDIHFSKVVDQARTAGAVARGDELAPGLLRLSPTWAKTR